MRRPGLEVQAISVRMTSLSGDVGVFGGTFDPVHIGHLAAAMAALDALRLEMVLFVPAADPPHKQSLAKTAADHRIAMLALAMAGNERFAISRVDVDRPGPHYTVDMLAALQAEHPQARLHFLLGSDSLAELPTWHKPWRLPQLGRLALLRRPGEEPDLARLEEVIPGLTRALCQVPMPLLEVSGTDLRQRVAAGRRIRYLVPDAVGAYIERHGLYRPVGQTAQGPRQRPLNQLLIATTNPGKLAELAALAADLAGVVVRPADLGLELRVPEMGTSWLENAAAKAQAYARSAGLPALADDSGLEVDALDGEPGLHSARWCSGGDTERWQRLLALMDDVPWERRTARYRAVTAIAWPDGRTISAEGTVAGRIAWRARGRGGFGYDPVFLVEDGGYAGHVSMAELPAEEKNVISHRARAVRQLLAALV